MPIKTITLDVRGRKLIIKSPGKTTKRGKPFWTFLLDEAQYRKNNERPSAIGFAPSEETPEQIAGTPRYSLYTFVSSNWLDSEWEKTIEPQIIAFIKKVRDQTKDLG